MSNKYRWVLAAGLVGSLALAGTAFAQGGPGRGHMGMGMMHNGVFGTVASVSGNTLTVTSKTWVKPTTGTTPTTTTTTYSIDATNAKVTKNGATSNVAGIVVGDNVMVTGTVTGTSVAATAIRDGMPKPGNGPKTKQPVIEGNGQPVIAGTVGTVNGNSFTITNKSGTYTVDDSTATVTRNNAASTASAVVAGDSVIVQGTVNGTSVTASSITDHAAAAAGTTNAHPGFFGGIGNFFKHLFGF